MKNKNDSIRRTKKQQQKNTNNRSTLSDGKAQFTITLVSRSIRHCLSLCSSICLAYPFFVVVFDIGWFYSIETNKRMNETQNAVLYILMSVLYILMIN